MSRDEIAELALAYPLSEDADLFVRSARPAVRLRQTDSSGDGRCRLGGRPLLDRAEDWPMWEGRPLSFIAALDLGELSGFETGLDLPPDGTLNFFFEAVEQRGWGFDPAHREAWRVLHCSGVGAPVSAPDGAMTFNEINLGPVQTMTVPTSQEPFLDAVIERNLEGFLDMQEVLLVGGWPDSPRHQVGGWPIVHQGPIEIMCQLVSNGINLGDGSYERDSPRVTELASGASDWQLLLQVESDDAAGWMWGDVGTLFYAIRREDLLDRKFERTWMILEC